MARITLVEGFQRIPEGTYIFRCDKVRIEQESGMVELTLVTKDGLVHNERNYLVTKDGKPNSGAQLAFSLTCRALLCNPDLKEVDTNDLCGHFMKATITHEVRKDPNDETKTKTYVQMKDKLSAKGFDESGYDLDKLFGGA